MNAGDELPRVPIALAVLLLVASVPAVADRSTVHIEDDDTLLLGDPTGQADVHVREQLLGQEVEAGTHKGYTFEVEPADNRLEIDLRYDPGQVTPMGPCLKANDLDMEVEGPGFHRSYPGCDGGGVTVLANGVPTGTYTVRVDAERGSTVCVPDEVFSPCSSPGIEYSMEIRVWSLG